MAWAKKLGGRGEMRKRWEGDEEKERGMEEADRRRKWRR